MPAHLSADTDLIRGYGSAAVGHADDLRAAAGLMTMAGTDPSTFGPVGAGFLAALTRAVEQEAQALARLSHNLIAAHDAARRSAQAYELADSSAAAHLAGRR